MAGTRASAPAMIRRHFHRIPRNLHNPDDVWCSAASRGLVRSDRSRL